MDRQQIFDRGADLFVRQDMHRVALRLGPLENSAIVFEMMADEVCEVRIDQT